MRQLAHVEQHLRDRPRFSRHNGNWALGEQLIPVLHLLLQPLTAQEIADTLGPGWTRGLVEFRFKIIRDTLLLTPSRQHLERLELLRIVMGLDPCWCGFREKAA